MIDRRVAEHLDLVFGGRADWAVVGGHAANLYRAEARFTVDTDVLISLGRRSMEDVARTMAEWIDEWGVRDRYERIVRRISGFATAGRWQSRLDIRSKPNFEIVPAPDIPREFQIQYRRHVARR